MKDIFGKAILDYHQGKATEDIYTETNISEEDILPLSYLFRSYDQMPLIEQVALDACVGKILDVGCGAGSHALYLQQKNMDVVAIDTSQGAIKTAKLRGVSNAQCVALMDFREGSFDTILMLMNGAGLLGPVNSVVENLTALKPLLSEQGQLLVDSSDLIYMYDQTDEGGVIVPADRYYGELDFKVSYMGEEDDPFTWLYIDPKLFEHLAEEAGYSFEIIAEGPNYDFLARLTPNL